jgi:hypothetical protein
VSNAALFALTDGGSGTVAGAGATFRRREHGLDRPGHRPEHALGLRGPHGAVLVRPSSLHIRRSDLALR